VWKDARAGYERVKSLDAEANHVAWLTPAPADNTWAIAVDRELAAQLGTPDLAGFAQYLAAGGRVKLAASVEFADNPGALPAFESAYGFHLAGDQLLVLAGGNTTATIRAAAEGISGIDAAMAYNTDGALDALGVTALADPRHTQPVYAPAPVIRDAVLARHPEIAAALAPVFAGLDLATLRRLNARIVADGEEPGAVAADYLRQATP
jgi:osmoprotectant transport system substrate-binding protein